MKTSAWIPAFCLGIAVSGMSQGQTAPHDLKLTVRHTSGAHSFDTTEYYSGKNSRSEMQIASGDIKGHRRAVIRQRGLDKVQVYDLDLDASEYVSYQTDLRGTTAGSRSWTVKPSGKTLLINIESVDTGERKEMFGLQARHIITREKRIGGPGNCYGGNSESEMDGWYVDFDIFPDWHRPVKDGINVAYLVVAHWGNSDRCSDKIEVHRSGPRTGFPLWLKTSVTSEIAQADGSSKSYTSTSETEVVELSQSPLDGRLFEVPAGFHKVDKIVDPTQQPLRLEAMSYWQRFKTEMRSIFR
jgi:hypothetical protein